MFMQQRASLSNGSGGCGRSCLANVMTTPSFLRSQAQRVTVDRSRPGRIGKRRCCCPQHMHSSELPTSLPRLSPAKTRETASTSTASPVLDFSGPSNHARGRRARLDLGIAGRLWRAFQSVFPFPCEELRVPNRKYFRMGPSYHISAVSASSACVRALHLTSPLTLYIHTLITQPLTAFTADTAVHGRARKKWSLARTGKISSSRPSYFWLVCLPPKSTSLRDWESP